VTPDSFASNGPMPARLSAQTADGMAMPASARLPRSRRPSMRFQTLRLKSIPRMRRAWPLPCASAYAKAYSGVIAAS
jgi:hypothetical protein